MLGRSPLRRVVWASLVVLALTGRILFAQVPSPSVNTPTQFPPEYLFLLEPPDRDVWQKPDLIFDALAIADGAVVADVGTGSGWFVIRLARRVGPKGRVIAQDVQPEMLRAVSIRVRGWGLDNIETVLGTKTDTRLPANTFDAVLLADTLGEIVDRVGILKGIHAALRPGGRLGVIEYTKAGYGPGPPMSLRVDAVVIEQLGRATGYSVQKTLPIPPYQFMVVLERPAGPGTKSRRRMPR